MSKLDRVDAEHLDQVARSRGYQLIRERCEAIREAKVRELIQPSDAQRTAELRGFIAGVAACLRVPDTLKRGEDGEEEKRGAKRR